MYPCSFGNTLGTNLCKLDYDLWRRSYWKTTEGVCGNQAGELVLTNQSTHDKQGIR